MGTAHRPERAQFARCIYILMGLGYKWLDPRWIGFALFVGIRSPVLERCTKVIGCKSWGSETHVKRTDGVGVMAGQAVAFPEVSMPVARPSIQISAVRSGNFPTRKGFEPLCRTSTEAY
jgi:hypothetical protein